MRVLFQIFSGMATQATVVAYWASSVVQVDAGNREELARQQPAQLHARQLRGQNVEKKQALPVHAGTRQVAANPAIQAQIHERSEGPDVFLVGSGIAQHAPREADEHVERERSQFAVVERGQPEQGAAGGAGHASADYPQQDGGFHREVSRLEVAHRHAHEHAQGERRNDEERQMYLLLQRPLFLKQQLLEVAGAHHGAADRGGHAQFHQQGYEDETRVHAQERLARAGGIPWPRISTDRHGSVSWKPAL